VWPVFVVVAAVDARVVLVASPLREIGALASTSRAIRIASAPRPRPAPVFPHGSGRRCYSADIRNKKSRYAGLLQSPLTDSNRRPPPYHAIQTATGGSQWQRFGASSSHFPAFRVPNVCHRLRPLCSITVASQ
jgi:hypothetical protein